ncbi:MAG: ribosome maturation factor RimM [Candidatus Caldatribacteriota bacterium]|nr:ribosome maturation factor RimM [Candidatus Caldatribacteriota bacterium]
MSEENFVTIGEIISKHGNKGEVKVSSLTDKIERFKKLKNIYIGRNLKLLEIIEVKIIKNNVILKLEGIDDINGAENLVGSFIKIEKDNVIKLSKDSYFLYDIIGLDVYFEETKYLGRVENIISTGSNDVYIVKSKNGKEILIPAIKEIIKNIDLEKKRIDIDLVDGLI